MAPLCQRAADGDEVGETRLATRGWSSSEGSTYATLAPSTTATRRDDVGRAYARAGW